MAAIAVISIFKDIGEIDQNIFYDFKIPAGRGDISELKINKKIIKFIDESYNANPLSVSSAIKNFDLIKNVKSKKNIILGDM